MWGAERCKRKQNNTAAVVRRAANRKAKWVNYRNVKTPRSGAWCSVVKQAPRKHVARPARGNRHRNRHNVKQSPEARLLSSWKPGGDSETSAAAWTVSSARRKWRQITRKVTPEPTRLQCPFWVWSCCHSHPNKRSKADEAPQTWAVCAAWLPSALSL